MLSMVSLPSSSLISLSVDFSLPPRKSVVSQLPAMVSAWSLYPALSCDWLCKMMLAEISLLRIVAISFSNCGICPMLLNSSSSSRTWTGRRPP
jgi:hypothetical protein